ncbi:hypothetical protein WDU94_004766 [Cyamophila willieti]
MMDIATGGNYRLAKPAMKELQNELKNRIDEATNHCAVSSSSGRDDMEVDNELADGEDGMITSTPAHSTRASLRRPCETPVRAPQSTLRGRGRRGASEEPEEAGGRGAKKPAKSQGKSSRRKKAASSSDEEMPAIEEDEDSEEEEREEEQPKPKSTRTRRR